jgi:hypothetical protein
MQTLSDVHVDRGGEQVWIIHSAVADIHASPRVTTAHLGVYADDAFVEVLDTTGTLGKKILFPAKDRLLLVSARGPNEDVYVTVDTAARRPLRQRSYPGIRGAFRMSPSGRLVLSNNALALHVVDTDSLVDRALPATASTDVTVWATREDVLYLARANQAGPAEPRSTQLLRLDLRGVDLGGPLASPSLVATIAGSVSSVVVSPDDRFAAVLVVQNTGEVQVAMVNLATGSTQTIESGSFPAFTRDGRVTIWQRAADFTHDLRLLDPATGATAPPAATPFRFPLAMPLLHRDQLIVTSYLFEDEPSFIYSIADGARTPMTSTISPSSRFEHPVRSELWIWEELDDRLRRLDLANGAVIDEITGVDSVAYRADTDDIVIGTFDHSVLRLSMATRALVGGPLVLPDPNSVSAPHKLTSD